MTGYLTTELRRVFRNRRYVFFTILYPVLMYVFFSNVGGGSRIGGQSAQAYEMVQMAAFGACGAAINIGMIIATDRGTGWNRVLRLTPLPSWGYLTGKLLTAFAVAVPAVVLVFGYAGVVNHVSMPAIQWIAAFLLLLAALIPFAALGIFGGYLVGASAAGSGPVLTVVWMALALFGGLWWPEPQMPSVMQHIAHLLPTFQMSQLSLHALAGTAPALTGIAVLVVWTAVLAALATWRYRNDTVTSLG